MRRLHVTVPLDDGQVVEVLVVDDAERTSIDVRTNDGRQALTIWQPLTLAGGTVRTEIC